MDRRGLGQRRMRSLHVSDLTDSGGAEAVFADTVRAAEALGHEVTTLVSDGRRSAFSYLFSVRWYRRMRAVLEEVQPDLVHLQNYYRFLSPSVLLAIRHHRRQHPELRVVHTAHDYHLACPNSGFQHYPGGRRTTFDLERPRIPLIAQFDHRTVWHSLLKSVAHLLSYRIFKLRREIDLVLCPSDLLRRVLANCGITIPSEMVRNPVHNFDAPDAEEDGLTRDPAVGLVYLGRVAEEKGLAEFITALDATGENSRLDVYGSGSAIPRLTRLTRTLKHAHVRLIPRVPRREVGATIARYAGFVHPSVWPENAPIAVVEAIVAGLPVLVPRGGGAEEIARLSEQWVLFDHGEPDSIADGLTALAQFRGSNRLREPEAFTFSTFTERLATIYNRLAGQGDGGRP